MSKLGLTKEERTLVAQVAAVSESSFNRLWHYSAALVPALGFGLYGLIRADFVALGLGFAALVLFTYWHVANELKAAALFSSLCSKIDSYEQDSGA